MLEDRTPLPGPQGSMPPEPPTEEEEMMSRTYGKEYFKEHLVGFLTVIPPTAVLLTLLDENIAELVESAWWLAVMFAGGVYLGIRWDKWPFNRGESLRTKLISIGLIGLSLTAIVLYHRSTR